MTTVNKAAWLDGAGQAFTVREAPMPTPQGDEIIVQNHAIAINPIDWKIRDYGLFMKTWPMVLGCDVAGIVTSVGSSVERFRVGDRVIGHAVSLAKQSPQYGGFQLYSAIPASKAASLPDRIDFEDGAVLPLAISTASAGLFQSAAEGHLGLAYPSVSEATNTGKTIAVYGASSSVGALATQLAASSGARVIAIASEHNFDFALANGAAEVYSYRSSSVVEDVVQAVKRSGHDFLGIYEAIGLPESYEITVPILRRLGGGNLAAVLDPPGREKLPEGTRAVYIMGLSDGTHPVWADCVTPMLVSARLKCAPKPHIVGRSLDDVQEACEVNKRGVSAKKVVIRLV